MFIVQNVAANDLAPVRTSTSRVPTNAARFPDAPRFRMAQACYRPSGYARVPLRCQHHPGDEI